MRKRILVVEDQEDSRRTVRDLLTANDYEKHSSAGPLCRLGTERRFAAMQ
jgi:CheY-like chemotaxis protein